MPVNLKGRSFLTLKDFSKEEMLYMLDLADDLKAKKRAGIRGNSLQGKNIALIFEKASTRTRCAFTVACIDEGGHPEFLGKNDIHLGELTSLRAVAALPIAGRYRVVDFQLSSMVHSGIKAIWNFTPHKIIVPPDIIVEYVDMFASLAVLSRRLAEKG